MTVDEYLMDIQKRADELIDDGDLDAILGGMSAQERNRWNLMLRVFVTGRMESSRDKAAAELRELIRSGAFKAAQDAYQQEMTAAVKKLALDRFYHHAGAAA